MRRALILHGIIIVLFSVGSLAQQLNSPDRKTNFTPLKNRLDYLEKVEILKAISNQDEEDNVSSGIDQGVVFRILGIASLAGFFASVTLFNAEIFDSLPVTLLIAGVVLLIMGN